MGGLSCEVSGGGDVLVVASDGGDYGGPCVKKLEFLDI